MMDRMAATRIGTPLPQCGPLPAVPTQIGTSGNPVVGSESLREPNAPRVAKPARVEATRVMPTVVDRLVATLNDLTWRRLASVNAAARRSVSTMLSAPAALGLLAPFMHGATEPELARVKSDLGLADVSDREFLAAVKNILSRAKVRTALWASPEFVVDKDFAERVHAELGTEIETVAPEQAQGRIDSWLFNGTHGRARNLAGQNPLASGAVVPSSLVALDPLWTNFFKIGDTIAEYPFVKADGRSVAIRMMTGELPCRSVASGDYRAARLQLEDNLAFICIVPAEEVPIENLVRDIASPSGMERFLSSLQPNQGMLYIPKIDIEARSHDGGLINEATRGPYSAIGSRKVELAGTGHEVATMRFSETGVTIGGGAVAKFWSGKLPASVAPAPPQVLEANRPFLYLVRDDATGLIIGAGVYEGPADPPLALSLARSLDLGGELGYVTAASGLVRAGERYWVVADDENFIASFPVSGGPGKALPVFPGELPQDPKERKSAKPDLEALLHVPRALSDAPHDMLLAIGSGSKPNRNRGVAVALTPEGEAQGAVQQVDWSLLNGELGKRFPKLNLEGACIVGDRIRLGQRGNGKKNVSAIVDLDLKEVVGAVIAQQPIPVSALRGVKVIDLGKERGVPWTITDLAALPDGRMLFTAAAEDTADVVGDGAVLGAGIGILNRDCSVASFRRVDPLVKLEGLAIVGIHGGAADVAAVSDADDRKVPSSMYTTSIEIS